MERIKPITITMEDGTVYTLEFSRETVEYAEKHGFKRDNIQNELMTRVPELFYYAFRKNHPDVKRKETDRILFDELGGLSEAAMEALVNLFNYPYLTLANDSGKPKNPKVTMQI